MLAGYLLAAKVSDAAVGLAVGIISIGFAARRMLGDGKAPPPVTQSRATAPGTFWGAVCGFTSMIAHAGGPPFQIYVMPQRLVAAGLRRHGRDLLRADQPDQGRPLYRARPVHPREPRPPRPRSSRSRSSRRIAGVWLVRRVPAERFYTIIYWLLIAVGLKLVFDGFMGLHLLS